MPSAAVTETVTETVTAVTEMGRWCPGRAWGGDRRLKQVHSAGRPAQTCEREGEESGRGSERLGCFRAVGPSEGWPCMTCEWQERGVRCVQNREVRSEYILF